MFDKRDVLPHPVSPMMTVGMFAKIRKAMVIILMRLSVVIV